MKDIIIKSSTDNTQYSELVSNYILTALPHVQQTSSSIKHGVFESIMGTRNLRQGPRPNIIMQGDIMKNISIKINEDQTIVGLTAIGPKKTKDDETVDLAELSMLRTLKCLYDTISQYYPNVMFVLRLEDYTGHYFEGYHKHEMMDTYINDLSMMIRILGFSSFIQVVRESEMGSYIEFVELSDEYLNLMLRYLHASTGLSDKDRLALEEYKILKFAGWSGVVHDETRAHYINTYQKLYGVSDHEASWMMARYFASALARKVLAMTGHTNPDFRFTFAPGVPQAGEYAMNYRTIPMKESKFHVAPWRAKGFFKIDENNRVRISVRSWNDLPEQYERGSISLSNSTEALMIKADYIL